MTVETGNHCLKKGTAPDLLYIELMTGFAGK